MQEMESASTMRISSTAWDPVSYLIRPPPPSGTAAVNGGRQRRAPWTIAAAAPPTRGPTTGIQA